MSVAVTGADGFIGRHVAAVLATRGHRVIGIDRRPMAGGRLDIAVRADLSRMTPGTDAAAALARADGVIHLAGAPGVRPSGRDTDRRRWRDNVLAGQRLLDVVPAAVPVVVVSSSSIYGGSHLGRPCREDDPLRPLGSYAATKAALEALAAQRARRGGAVAVARPFTVAGEGQRPDMAIARWLRAARDRRPLEVFGSLERRRDITDVRDVAEGLVRLLERLWAGHTEPAVVNLGSGVAHRLTDIVAAVSLATGTAPAVTVRPAGVDEPVATLADTSRCVTALGLQPNIDLDALVRRQAAQPGRQDTAGRPAGAPRPGALLEPA